MPDSLYKKLQNKLLNKPVIAYTLLALAIIGGIAQFGQSVLPFYKSLWGKNLKAEENSLMTEHLVIEAKIRPLYFVERQHELESESSTRLEQYAEILKKIKFQRLIIEGHSSVLEPNANYPLSRYRARAIGEALIKAGIPSLKIEVVGYGAEAASKNTTEGYQNNGVIRIIW